MMPQRDASDPIYQQTDPTYGGYEGNPIYSGQHAKNAYAQPPGERAAEKVYPAPRDHKNMLRLSMFVIAMVTLLLFAVLCIFFLGGTGGWVSLSVAAFVIFLVTVVAIDKIA